MSFLILSNGPTVSHRGPTVFESIQEGGGILVPPHERLSELGLQPRSTNILCLAAGGQTAEQIAPLYYMTPSGICDVLKRSRDVIGASNRANIARRLLELGGVVMASAVDLALNDSDKAVLNLVSYGMPYETVAERLGFTELAVRRRIQGINTDNNKPDTNNTILQGILSGQLSPV